MKAALLLQCIILFVLNRVAAEASPAGVAASDPLAASAISETSALSEHSTFSSPSSCCAALLLALPGNVAFPASSSYQASVDSYWSDQEKISPACIVQPASTQDVSSAVKVLVSKCCRFAVRGGGHTPWAGAANIGPDGVTVDLSLMTRVTYDVAKSLASVQPGLRWAQVYDALSPLGVAIPGGRAGSVGAAGLTIGGRNSFFAARYGFVCDNVANFQVVLGNGSIVNANATANSDLFQALKGGSSNFGIVTRFDYYAFPSGDIWGGVVVWPNGTTDQQLQAFVNFETNLTNNRFASCIGIWLFNSTTGSTVVSNVLDYTASPVVPKPPVFQEFFDIPGIVADTTRVTNLTDLVTELESAFNRRNIFLTLTFQLDLSVLQKAVDVFNAKNAIAAAEAKADFASAILFQPIPPFFSQYSVQKGGNVLGLDREDQNLVLFLWDQSWESPQDDDLFARLGADLISEIRQYAASLQKDAQYIYLNYADKSQNPLESYGRANVQKIRDASRKYDPRQVFQYLVPGGFKITEV